MLWQLGPLVWWQKLTSLLWNGETKTAAAAQYLLLELKSARQLKKKMMTCPATQQERPESPAVPVTWHAGNYQVQRTLPKTSFSLWYNEQSNPEATQNFPQGRTITVGQVTEVFACPTVQVTWPGQTGSPYSPILFCGQILVVFLTFTHHSCL